MKTPKASGALRRVPDPMPSYACFARLTPLRYIGKIGRTRVRLWGSPLDQILDPLLGPPQKWTWKRTPLWKWTWKRTPPPPRSGHRRGPPTPEVDMEEGPPRSGHGRGPPQKVVVVEDQLRSIAGQAGGMP